MVNSNFKTALYSIVIYGNLMYKYIYRIQEFPTEYRRRDVACFRMSFFCVDNKIKCGEIMGGLLRFFMCVVFVVFLYFFVFVFWSLLFYNYITPA